MEQLASEGNTQNPAMDHQRPSAHLLLAKSPSRSLLNAFISTIATTMSSRAQPATATSNHSDSNQKPLPMVPSLKVKDLVKIVAKDEAAPTEPAFKRSSKRSSSYMRGGNSQRLYSSRVRRPSHAPSSTTHSPASSPPGSRRSSFTSTHRSSKSFSIIQTASTLSDLHGNALDSDSMLDWVDVYMNGPEQDTSSHMAVLETVLRPEHRRPTQFKLKTRTQDLLHELDSELLRLSSDADSKKGGIQRCLEVKLNPLRMPSKDIKMPGVKCKMRRSSASGVFANGDESMYKRGSLVVDSLGMNAKRASRIRSMMKTQDSLERATRNKVSSYTVQALAAASDCESSKQCTSVHSNVSSNRSFRVSVLGRLDGLLGSIDDEFGDALDFYDSDPDWFDENDSSSAIMHEDVQRVVLEYKPSSSSSVIDKLSIIEVTGTSGKTISLFSNNSSSSSSETLNERPSVRVSVILADLAKIEKKPQPRIVSILKRTFTNGLRYYRECGNTSDEPTTPVLSSRSSCSGSVDLELSDFSDDEFRQRGNRNSGATTPTSTSSNSSNSKSSNNLHFLPPRPPTAFSRKSRPPPRLTSLITSNEVKTHPASLLSPDHSINMLSPRSHARARPNAESPTPSCAPMGPTLLLTITMMLNQAMPSAAEFSKLQTILGLFSPDTATQKSHLRPRIPVRSSSRSNLRLNPEVESFIMQTLMNAKTTVRIPDRPSQTRAISSAAGITFEGVVVPMPKFADIQDVVLECPVDVSEISTLKDLKVVEIVDTAGRRISLGLPVSSFIKGNWSLLRAWKQMDFDSVSLKRSISCGRIPSMRRIFNMKDRTNEQAPFKTTTTDLAPAESPAATESYPNQEFIYNEVAEYLDAKAMTLTRSRRERSQSLKPVLLEAAEPSNNNNNNNNNTHPLHSSKKSLSLSSQFTLSSTSSGPEETTDYFDDIPGFGPNDTPMSSRRPSMQTEQVYSPMTEVINLMDAVLIQAKESSAEPQEFSFEAPKLKRVLSKRDAILHVPRQKLHLYATDASSQDALNTLQSLTPPLVPPVRRQSLKRQNLRQTSVGREGVAG
ncbi:hypothetical protein HDU80_001413 [Chytriomyces hyalinus]|nr:hypothetical protein HDU80_001413 [Chytriomyces hyalinus]